MALPSEETLCQGVAWGPGGRPDRATVAVVVTWRGAAARPGGRPAVGAGRNGAATASAAASRPPPPVCSADYPVAWPLPRPGSTSLAAQQTRPLLGPGVRQPPVRFGPPLHLARLTAAQTFAHHVGPH